MFKPNQKGSFSLDYYNRMLVRGQSGRICSYYGNRNESMHMVKRAWIYLRRNYKRSVLLLLLMLVVSGSILIGLSVWTSIQNVTKEVEQTLGTSVNFRLSKIVTQDPSFGKQVKSKFGTAYLAYDGPDFNWDTVNQVLDRVDGITDYNLECYQTMYADNLSLIPGLYNLSGDDADPFQQQINEMYKGVVDVYGNRDTSLYSKFRTGAFKLVEGRHIRSDDIGKALISDKLADLNDLKVGDPITLSIRAGEVGQAPVFDRIGDDVTLKIVGIFHVNGYQPAGVWVAESDMTYNWIFADVNTVWKLNENFDQDLYNGVAIEHKFDNVTFFVGDPSRLQDVIKQIRNLKWLDTAYYDVSVDDTMFKSTVDPLNSIRNLVGGLALAIVLGCSIVLFIIFTMWVRSRRQEIAIYLSMGISKAAIFGQFILEAGLIAVLAGAISFAACRQVPNIIGNQMLANKIEEAQPEAKEPTREEIHQAAQSGTLNELFAYESGEYAGPEHIDFTPTALDFAIILLLDLVSIAAAIGRAGWSVLKLQPREIMTGFS